MGIMAQGSDSEFRRLRQEDCKFKATLGYIMRHWGEERRAREV